MKSLISTFEAEEKSKRSYRWEHSVGARKLICSVADNVIALVVSGAPKTEVELALDTLSALTGVPRSYES